MLELSGLTNPVWRTRDLIRDPYVYAPRFFLDEASRLPWNSLQRVIDPTFAHGNRREQLDQLRPPAIVGRPAMGVAAGSGPIVIFVASRL
ncbi:MAG: hypothetical protein WDO68_17890 [Gammaproteobacteria bacterium]